VDNRNVVRALTMSTDQSPAATEAALGRVRAVLSHPAGPGNIGASARALKAMGLERLVLLNPRQFPDARATESAVGAADILAEAVVCSTLDEALAGATLTIALTARRRDLAPPCIDAREAAQLAVAEAAAGGEVAFVFGTEASGLSNEEVIRCQRAAHIASDPSFPSLNLAAAVQVVAYEVRYALVGACAAPSERTPAATYEETEGLFCHLDSSLQRSGFLDPANPRRLMERLRRIFGRARLESQELNVLRGMLAAWDGKPRRRER
jgi:tRNA/rRNA methyltransferase